MRGTLPALGLLLIVLAPVSAADWQPGKAAIMTHWAKDVTPAKVHPEYPRPQMVRGDWQNLNGLWQFAEAKEGEAAPIGKKLDEQILVPFPVESALSGVTKPLERVWYRRTFQVPKDWRDQRVLLHFGAVNWESAVWINGKKQDVWVDGKKSEEHRGGYDGFSIDITDSLKDGEQELIVWARNPVDAGTQPRGKQVKKPGGIFYTASTGIWQTVWLEPVPKTSIQAVTITPDVTAGKVRLLVATQGNAEKYTVRVYGTVKKAGNTIPREETWRWGDGKAGKTIEMDVPKDCSHLWSPEDPFLYDVEIALCDGDKVIDKVQSYFGLRSISVGKDANGTTRLLLNGKPYFQVGPLDQGFWPDGLYTAPTDEALRYDIEITKKLGFNLIRKHVKVEPARWYYWCDKLGMIVWQDMPSADRGTKNGEKEITKSPEAAAQFESELKRMIDGRRNHPSIVMWVPFNEGWGQYDTVRVTNAVKKMDPERLVNCASGWNDMKVGDVHDIHVYPGPGSPEPEPTRAAVLGEFGGLGLGLKEHMWTPNSWSYQGTRDQEDLTRKYENLLRRVYLLRDKPGLSAAVYTQTTDVEMEINGLLTYDRAVIKVDAERVARANRGDFSKAALLVEIAPSSREQPQTWRFTTEKPSEGWFKPEFKDNEWKEGPGGFGTKGTPGAVVRTEWKTADIWLRREFELPEGKLNDPQLLLHHDDDVEVYINGVLATKLKGYKSEYGEVPLSAEARAALKSGKNVFAVHCHQNSGGQYIDVGIVDVKLPGGK